MTGRTIAMHRRAGQRGAVAVEFALVVPVLVMLMMGILTAGMSYSKAVGLSNAVREASRFAASTSALNASGTLDWTTWKSAVFTRTRAVQFDDPSREATVCVRVMRNPGTVAAVPTVDVVPTACDAGAATAGPSPAAPAVGPQQCVVLVWATRGYEIEALLASFDSVMLRQSVALYERTCT